MLAQGCKEVIVVDYACPQETAAYVKEHFPAVRIVTVNDAGSYSHSRARNAGAALTSSDVIVFCDADTILADGAIRWLSDNMPVQAYGYFDLHASRLFNETETQLGGNQLRGFQALPADAFKQVGGYDECLEGYAAGEDIDIERKVTLLGLRRFAIDPMIIKKILEHDDLSRIENYDQPISQSYGAGLLYRTAKEVLLRLSRKSELELAIRRKLYEESRRAIRMAESSKENVAINLNLDSRAVGMPRQLGYEKGEKRIILRVELSLENKL